MKKIDNIQIKDARGRDVFLAADKPFMLDELLMIAIEQSKKGLRLANAAKAIMAAQSVKAPMICLENADLAAVNQAFKACESFTDILVEQVSAILDKATDAIVEVK